MFNNKQRLNRRTHRSQSGNVIIIAVFVIVVLGMLAANLVRINWSNQDTLTREFLGTQAWFLAQSANEWALTEVFPFDQSVSSGAVTINCTTLNDGIVNGSITPPSALFDDLPCSQPIVSCESVGGSGVPEELNFSVVSSRATCGESSGVFMVERTHEVWVRGIDE